MFHILITYHVGIKRIKIKEMNKDTRKKQCYFVFFNTLKNKIKA